MHCTSFGTQTRLFLILVTFVAGGYASPTIAAAQESGLLGSWRVVDERLTRYGHGLEIIWTFTDDEIVITDGDGAEISRNKYQVDNTLTPKQITTQVKGEPDEERPGIFEISDNKLRLSQNVESGPRPKTFEESSLLNLERINVAGNEVGSSAGEEREICGVEFCWCPAGKFRMGSPADENGHRADETQVEVELSQGLWMAKYEVTQAQWRKIAGDMPVELNAGAGDDYPVYGISFIQAEDFCRKLTEQARNAEQLPEGWDFCLPTEAQWEYACRAGTTTAFSCGEKLTTANATFGKPYNGTPTGEPGSAAAKVGSYAPNAWGLYDMHGNEWEWCRDWYHARLPGGVDPDLSEEKGVRNGDGTYSRVRRGGAWVESAEFCRSAQRLRYEPERHSDHIGFRVCLVKIEAED